MSHTLQTDNQKKMHNKSDNQIQTCELSDDVNNTDQKSKIIIKNNENIFNEQKENDNDENINLSCKQELMTNKILIEKQNLKVLKNKTYLNKQLNNEKTDDLNKINLLLEQEILKSNELKISNNKLKNELMNLKLSTFNDEMSDKLTNREISLQKENVNKKSQKIKILKNKINELNNKILTLEEKNEDDYFKIMRELSMIILSKNNSSHKQNYVENVNKDIFNDSGLIFAQAIQKLEIKLKLEKEVKNKIQKDNNLFLEDLIYQIRISKNITSEQVNILENINNKSINTFELDEYASRINNLQNLIYKSDTDYINQQDIQNVNKEYLNKSTNNTILTDSELNVSNKNDISINDIQKSNDECNNFELAEERSNGLEKGIKYLKKELEDVYREKDILEQELKHTKQEFLSATEDIDILKYRIKQLEKHSARNKKFESFENENILVEVITNELNFLKNKLSGPNREAEFFKTRVKNLQKLDTKTNRISKFLDQIEKENLLSTLNAAIRTIQDLLSNK